MSPKALSGAMSGAATSAMVLFAVISVPLRGTFREAGDVSGLEGMPSFSAAWIDAFSRAPWCAGFRSRTSLSDWGVRSPE